MKRDLYMKTVLTIIAILLAVLALRPVKVVPDAKALDAVQCTGSLKGRTNDPTAATKAAEGKLTSNKDFDLYITCR
jgi:hypothetical protein